MRWLIFLFSFLSFGQYIPSGPVFPTTIAPALVAHITAQNPNSAITTGINTTGATLLILVAGSISTTSDSISDSKGNVWTALTSQTDTASGTRETIYYVANPIVGTAHTFSNSPGGGNIFTGICVAAFSGVKISSPFAAQNGANTTTGSTTATTGTITPSNGDLVITGLGAATTVSGVSVNSGMTIIDLVASIGGNNYGAGLAWVVSGGSSINPVWTNGGGMVFTGTGQTVASFLHQ